ncbi:MAG: aliphatic sulfonate ABC transporter substrate-binding protein [Patescibacteria group bacterium]
MKKMKFLGLNLVVGIFVLLLVGCQLTDTTESNTDTSIAEKQIIKVGYFPNITHSQAVVGIADGTFQEYLGDEVEIEPITFNSGTSEMEALFAGEIDIGNIGPVPAVNGYVKSEGEAIRIISGANSGGAVLVGQPEFAQEFKEKGAEALRGKKIASPSQGNTQDISLRNYIKENGLEGEVEILPINNADQLTLFAQDEIDGSWVPEPWGTRFIIEADGELIIDERDLWPKGKFTTTHVIANTEFLEEHPELVKKYLEAHVELTGWINDNPEEAQKIVNSEIERLTTKKIPEEVLSKAWERIDVTVEPIKESVFAFADRDYEEGFLGEEELDLTNLYDLRILNEITGKKY